MPMPVSVSVFIMLVGLSSMLPAMLIGTMATMFSLVVRHIDLVVPLVANKIDGPVAGIVLVAVFAPFFLVSGWYMEIDRLMDHMDGGGTDHDRLGVNYLGPGGVADINLSEKAGLADADGHVDIRGRGLSRNSHKHNSDDQQ